MTAKKAFIISALILIAFLLISNLALARTLENDYPKIPLPGLGGSFSLNDINELKGDLEGRDPLVLFVLYFYTFSVSVVGIAALGAIIIAGLKLLSSGANPGARSDAKSRLQAAILGIVILLGSWIILNVINPELTILHRPGEAIPGVATTTFNIGTMTEENPFLKMSAIAIDINTAKYGGIVVYSENNFGGRSQVVLGDVKSFFKNWVQNNTVASIKYNPACDINLYDDDDFGGQQRIELRPAGRNSKITPYDDDEELSGSAVMAESPDTGFIHFPNFGSLSISGGGTWKDTVSSLKILNPEECVGSALIAYEDPGYKGRQKIFLSSDNDLGNNGYDFDADIVKINDAISSIALSENLKAQLCVNATPEKDPCATIETSSEMIGDLDFLNNKISFLSLSGKEGGAIRNIQKALIVFQSKNFEGQTEIFITDDPNTKKGNRGLILANGIAAGSLMIIGGLEVELFEKTNFDATGEKITITNGADGWSCTNSFGDEGCAGGIIFQDGGVLYITDVDGIKIKSGNGWRDDISSIRIRNK